jgi:hypothetical protein
MSWFFEFLLNLRNNDIIAATRTLKLRSRNLRIRFRSLLDYTLKIIELADVLYPDMSDRQNLVFREGMNANEVVFSLKNIIAGLLYDRDFLVRF